MNAPAKIEAARPVSTDPRDIALAASLDAIRFRSMALRACWAMLGLCREAEQLGLDVTYWRDLAADIERRAK